MNKNMTREQLATLAADIGEVVRIDLSASYGHAKSAAHWGLVEIERLFEGGRRTPCAPGVPLSVPEYPPSLAAMSKEDLLELLTEVKDVTQDALKASRNYAAAAAHAGLSDIDKLLVKAGVRSVSVFDQTNHKHGIVQENIQRLQDRAADDEPSPAKP